MINLDGNRLAGTVPPELVDPLSSSLQRLTLADNERLSGTLLASLGQLSALTDFGSKSTAISGTLPGLLPGSSPAGGAFDEMRALRTRLHCCTHKCC